MPRGDGARGRIAIVEMVLGELNDPGLGALIDMNMLAASPSQERSLDEYDALLAAAGPAPNRRPGNQLPTEHHRGRCRAGRPWPCHYLPQQIHCRPGLSSGTSRYDT